MSNRIRTLSSGLPLLLAAMAANAASPHINGAHVGLPEQPTVSVVSQGGQQYDALGDTREPFATTLYGACSNGKKLKAAWTELLNWDNSKGDAYLDALPHNATSMPVQTINLPGGGIILGPVEYSNAARNAAIAACNDNMQHLMQNSGMSKAQVLSTPWVLHDVPVGAIRGTLSCEADDGAPFGVVSKHYNDEIPALATVRCEAMAPPKTPTASNNVAVGFSVTEAHLNVSPGFYKGQCPKEVTLSMLFRSVGPGALSYRFETPEGGQSPIYSTQITDTYNGIYTKQVVKTFSVPLAPTTPGGNSGGGFGGNGMSGFAVEQDPVDPLPGGHQPPTIDQQQYQNQALPPNVHKGSFRVRVLSPNNVVSDYDDYHIECTPSVAPGIQGSGTIQMNPKPMTPPPASEMSATPSGPGPQAAHPGQPGMRARDESLEERGQAMRQIESLSIKRSTGGESR